MENKRNVSILLMLLAGMPALSMAADEYNLYTPHKVASGQAPATPNEGVLTRTITIKRGDTLWQLSRKYTGLGSYYPQILPFNTIDNPDLIYAGKSLQIPVPRGASAEAPAAQPEKPAKRGKWAKEGRKATSHKATQKKVADKPAVAPRRSPAAETPTTPSAGAASQPATSGAGSQGLYQHAVTIYKKGEYRQALDAFDAFLARYPDSPLAADATLYRADCYMKLSEH